MLKELALTLNRPGAYMAARAVMLFFPGSDDGATVRIHVASLDRKGYEKVEGVDMPRRSCTNEWTSSLLVC